MTRKDFENVFKGLLDAFPSAFNAARVERITAIIHGFSQNDLKRLNDHLLDKSRYAPLPDDFKTAISELGLIRGSQAQSAPYKTKKIDIAHLEGEWFFDDYKVFARGKSVKDCRMVIRSENPDHPMVIKAALKEKECLAGNARYIPTTTYQKGEIKEEVYEFFYGKKKTLTNDALTRSLESLR